MVVVLLQGLLVGCRRMRGVWDCAAIMVGVEEGLTEGHRSLGWT